MSKYEIKNSKRVQLSDNVRFRCTRCTNCCRKLEGSVPIEALDAWRIAKNFNITVSEFYDRYTEVFFMEEVDFPIFTLKTVGNDNACIFLEGKKCSIQDNKPRTCRMYPFWIEPGETPEDFKYNLSTEQRHHPKGSLIKVKDWMKDNFSDDEKKFLAEDYKAMYKIAPLYNKLRAEGVNMTELLSILLLHRYFMYETEQDFFEQFERNNSYLISKLKRMLERNELDEQT